MKAQSLPKVLHIEDNADIAKVVAKILETVAQVVHVENLQDARERLTGETFDVVILDLVLPDGSGFDLVGELKQRHPPLPVVIHSAHEVSETTHNVDAVVSKMYTRPKDFRATISRLARGEGLHESRGEPADA